MKKKVRDMPVIHKPCSLEARAGGFTEARVFSNVLQACDSWNRLA